MDYPRKVAFATLATVSSIFTLNGYAHALSSEATDYLSSCEAAAKDHAHKMKIVFEAINKTELAQDDEFLTTVGNIASPNLIRYDLTGNIPGIRGEDAPKNFISSLKLGFSDLELVIDHIFANCDYVTIRFKTVGTNDGEFLGFPPTNKSIQVNNINIYRFENGRVAETWQLYDALTMARQLGLPLETIEAKAEE